MSNNYEDGKWRIACDPRRENLNEPGDFTFKSRGDAAKAERDLVRVEALEIQAMLSNSPVTDHCYFPATTNAAA